MRGNSASTICCRDTDTQPTDILFRDGAHRQPRQQAWQRPAARGGFRVPLEKVYRMRLDGSLRTRVGDATRALLPEPVLFFGRVNRLRRTNSSRTASARMASPVSRRCCLP